MHLGWRPKWAEWQEAVHLCGPHLHSLRYLGTRLSLWGSEERARIEPGPTGQLVFCDGGLDVATPSYSSERDKEVQEDWAGSLRLHS